MLNLRKSFGHKAKTGRALGPQVLGPRSSPMWGWESHALLRKGTPEQRREPVVESGSSYLFNAGVWNVVILQDKAQSSAISSTSGHNRLTTVCMFLTQV